MALVKIDYPADLTSQSDFSAHGDLIEAGFWDKVNSPLLVRDGVIPQGAVLQIGSAIYHGTSDTAITGTASDYVRVTAGISDATAEYVATLTGVEWSKQYNGYYDTSDRLYIFDEGKALAAGQIASVFGRYLMQDKDGNVNINKLVGTTEAEIIDVAGDLRNGTVNPSLREGGRAAGYYTGSNVDETDLPIGTLVAAIDTSGLTFNRNQVRAVYLALDDQYSLVGSFGPQLLGTWRSRGRSGSPSSSTNYWLFQRTA